MTDVDTLTQPATMFWQDAAVLAMEAVAARIDHGRGGQPWFWLNLTTDPPRLEHQSWDYCDMSGRWMDALIRGRLMTGSTRYAGTEDLLAAWWRRATMSRAS